MIILDLIVQIYFIQSGKFIVGNHENAVEVYTLDDGVPDAIILRFTAPATHIVVSKDEKTVAAASRYNIIDLCLNR